MFALSRNYQLLSPIVDDILAARKTLLETFGTPVENSPGAYFIPEERREEATKQMEQLDEVESDVKLYKILLTDIEKVNLSLETMNNLLPIVEEEES